LVSFQEGFHLTVKESIAAACSDTRVPSFSRSSFSSSSSRSNVHYGKYTMEVFGLQTIEETVRTSLPYVQYAMAPCDRQDIRPWCEKLSELAERSGEACDSMAWPSTVNSKVRSGIPMATVGPKPREGSPGRGVPRATKPLEENNKFHKVR
jgi:hypothetical protein